MFRKPTHPSERPGKHAGRRARVLQCRTVDTPARVDQSACRSWRVRKDRKAIERLTSHMQSVGGRPRLSRRRRIPQAYRRCQRRSSYAQTITRQRLLKNVGAWSDWRVERTFWAGRNRPIGVAGFLSASDWRRGSLPFFGGRPTLFSLWGKLLSK